jgi:hypothetical protein
MALKRVRGVDKMPKQAKTNARGKHVTDSAIVMRGRKALMKANGLNGRVRSPLTQQLIETLSSPDSYVSIPLTTAGPRPPRSSI